MDCTLLLVDDEPDISLAMSRALKPEGYKILMANSGPRALQLMREHAIDVIVSDHRMAGMTGAQLLSEVRASYPQIVRIMLSGHTDVEAVVQAVNDGAIYKFLTKPWCNDNLRAIMKEAAAVAGTSRDNTPDNPQAQFCQRISEVTDPARLVVFEIRNTSVKNFLDNHQVHAFVDELQQRCRQMAGVVQVNVTPLSEMLLAVVIDQVDANAMDELARVVNNPYYLAAQVAPIRLALGYADSEPPGDQPRDNEQWLQKALIALTATNFAGEVTAFSGAIQGDLHERHSLERDMLEGLENKEFFLQIQPQVGGQSLAIEGAESLCRWLHPSRGMIAPLQFIDLAEKNGFIHDLGIWVIRETCRVAGLLKRRGIDSVRVSFNVSPRQFSLPGWIEAIAECAHEEQVDLSQLEVEITESTVMDNPDRAMAIMTRLKDLGVYLAMDDFGTGHSSLALLNNLPIDVLKFDRSLVMNVEEDERSRTLFMRLVEMAHELGLKSIAEGVETPGQVALCQQLGCHLIQGYAFYKPVAVGDFFQLLEGTQGMRH